MEEMHFCDRHHLHSCAHTEGERQILPKETLRTSSVYCTGHERMNSLNWYLVHFLIGKFPVRFLLIPLYKSNKNIHFKCNRIFYILLN